MKKRKMQEIADFFDLYVCRNSRGVITFDSEKPKMKTEKNGFQWFDAPEKDRFFASCCDCPVGDADMSCFCSEAGIFEAKLCEPKNRKKEGAK